MSEEQEFIHEVDPPKEEEPKITLLDVLHLELQEYMKKALALKKQIEEAKTDYKKKYYGKKLKKNNMEALKVLTAIERVTKESQMREAHVQQQAAVYENTNDKESEAKADE